MNSGAAPGSDPPGQHSTWSRSQGTAAALAVVTALAAASFSWNLRQAAPGLAGAQRTTHAKFATRFAATAGAIADLRSGLRWDGAFVLAYVAFGVLVFSLFRRTDCGERRPLRAGAIAGSLLLAGAGLADLIENHFLRVALRHPLARSVGQELGAMRGAGVAKWALLGAAVIALVLLVATRPRSPYPRGLPGDRPPPPGAGPHPWDPPSGPDGGTRLGVCLSGGGIRSAAFALGGLQALQDNGTLARAEYLAAASGGGYLAAGWACSNASGGAVTASQAWSRSSPEERWFRDNSSYLVPDLLGGLKGVGRLLSGVVVNFLVVWLMLFLVARPVGWVIAAAHRELRPVAPVTLARDTVGEMAIGAVIPAGTAEAVVDGAALQAQRFEVSLKPVQAKADQPARANEVCFDTMPFDPGDRQHCFNVEQKVDRNAVVEVRGGKAEVLVQPEVQLDQRCPSDDMAPSEACQVFRHLRVTRQPKVALKDAAAVGPLRADQLKVTQQAQVRSRSGLVGRPAPRYQPWMWQGSLGPLVAGALLGLWVIGRRPGHLAHRIGQDVARALILAGLACLLVMIALPALASWLPGLAAHLPGTDLELGDSLLPSGGLLAVSVAAARQFFSGDKKSAGTAPADAKAGSSLWAKVRRGLSGSKDQLTWYETSPTKILLLVFLVIGFVASFVAQLQYAIANGLRGRLMGVSFVRDHVPNWAFQPEWKRFVLVVALLALFGWGIDAHAWSLYPFYKRRLSSAYLLERSGNRAAPRNYDDPLPFSVLADPVPVPPGPKLVLCCSVNLSERGVVPPGRRAASFTFSSDHIGGPLVGYVRTSDYWDWLPEERRRDITIPSAMAISGAAFSPAMGKTNLGPVGSVLALANLRLGVWLPHPQRVTEANAGSWRLWRRPGFTWFLREVFNRYSFQRRYLYVSDGGHWDNLGLVELLRRGCTEIICISAAGDGARSFGTIAEAMALAREELGVDMVLDPTPLRPPAPPGATPSPAPRPGATVAPRPPPKPRELRRRDASDKAEPFAPASFVVGTYRWRSSSASGTITYVETALTEDLPFDVHGFAESETIFPDDSTADQVFNHRQFEAFRALGYHQVRRAFPASAVDPAVNGS